MQETLAATNGRVSSEVLERLRLLEQENALLQHAMERRVVIEQAKGAISARCDVPPDIAFELLRGLARSQRRDIHSFAAEVVANGGRLSADDQDT